MSDNKEKAKRIFNDAPIIEEASDSFKEGVFQGIQLGLDAPLTEEKVREMVPQLEWKETGFGHEEAEAETGDYNIDIPENKVVHKVWDNKFNSEDEAKQACQRDYEDRVLRCLGFELKKEE